MLKKTHAESAKAQSFNDYVKLRVAVIASSPRVRSASPRPENAEKATLLDRLKN